MEGEKVNLLRRRQRTTSEGEAAGVNLYKLTRERGRDVLISSWENLKPLYKASVRMEAEGTGGKNSHASAASPEERHTAQAGADTLAPL